MRTLKELFNVMLIHQPLFTDTCCSGLCSYLYRLAKKEVFSSEEYWLLCDYVDENRPSWYSRHYSYKQRHSLYYWPEYEWYPREKWIKSQIQKLK